MEQEKLRVIDTHNLFKILNDQRKNKSLVAIEDSLIANKLGILFALKAGCYVNFKNDTVKLPTSQWTILQEILNQHFNVELPAELDILTTSPDRLLPTEASPHPHSVGVPQTNFFARVTEFLGRKIYPQPATTEENYYMVDITILFKMINTFRKNQHLGEIEDLSIANKLGILFALKTHCYLNFKQKLIELPTSHLIVLQEIVTQQFNVTIDIKLCTVANQMTVKSEQSAIDLAISPKMRNFFKKRKNKMTEMPKGAL
jgi:hypothetical protein